MTTTNYIKLFKTITEDGANSLSKSLRRDSGLDPVMYISGFGAVGVGEDNKLYYRRYTPSLLLQEAKPIEEHNTELIDFLLWAAVYANGHFTDSNGNSRNNIDACMRFLVLACRYYMDSTNEGLAEEIYKLVNHYGAINGILSIDTQYTIMKSTMYSIDKWPTTITQYNALMYADLLRQELNRIVRSTNTDGAKAVSSYTKDFLRRYPVQFND